MEGHLKSGDTLELKPDATDITEGAVEVKVLQVDGKNVVLETTSASGVHTKMHMALSQVEATFKLKRAQA
jgi:hypothetical protein